MKAMNHFDRNLTRYVLNIIAECLSISGLHVRDFKDQFMSYFRIYRGQKIQMSDKSVGHELHEDTAK